MHLTNPGFGRVRLLASTLVLGLVLSLGSLVTPSFATAAAANTLGTVSGTITGLENLPKGDVTIQLRSDLYESPIVEFNRSSGNFRVGNLPESQYHAVLSVVEGNSYKVIHAQVLKSSTGYFFTAGARSQSSHSFEAAAPTGNIEGSITRVGKNSIYSPKLYAWLYQVVEGKTLSLGLQAAVANENKYRFEGVVAGEYAVERTGDANCTPYDYPGDQPWPGGEQDFLDMRATDFHSDWGNGKPSPAQATKIKVASGQTVFGIDGVVNSSHLDVKYGRKFAGDISWMYERDISTGWKGFCANVYRPTLSVTREAMAAFIYRYAGSPDFTAPNTPSFTDVPKDAKFYKQIEWMKSAKLTTGIKDGSKLKYAPKDSISREAMAAFLYRLAGKPAPNGAAAKTFIDVPKNQKFAKEIAWMSSTGVTTGWTTPQGLAFRPLEPVKRDAMAAFLHRYDTKH